DLEPLREPERRRYAGAAAEVEHPSAVRETTREVSDESFAWVADDPSAPGEIRLGDRVVAVSDRHPRGALRLIHGLPTAARTPRAHLPGGSFVQLATRPRSSCWRSASLRRASEWISLYCTGG